MGQRSDHEGPAAGLSNPTTACVTATVVAAEGLCPDGYGFQIGDSWAVNGLVQGPRELCPMAARLLERAAARLREGHPDGEEVRCLGPNHRVIFALQARRWELRPSPARGPLKVPEKGGERRAA